MTARSIALSSQLLPSERSLSHRASLSRTLRGFVRCSGGDEGRPTGRFAAGVMSNLLAPYQTFRTSDREAGRQLEIHRPIQFASRAPCFSTYTNAKHLLLPLFVTLRGMSRGKCTRRRASTELQRRNYSALPFSHKAGKLGKTLPRHDRCLPWADPENLPVVFTSPTDKAETFSDCVCFVQVLDRLGLVAHFALRLLLDRTALSMGINVIRKSDDCKNFFVTRKTRGVAMQLVAEILTVMGCVLAVIAVISALIGVGLTALGWLALWCVSEISDRIGGHE